MADQERERVRRVRYAQREMVDGRLVAPGDVAHGRGETFTDYGCRCHYCTRADLRLQEAWARLG